MRRCRDYGRSPGILPPGKLNAITDVEGVAVGHVTRIVGRSTRTGVTAILPHQDNIFAERVPAGVAVGNGHGKLAGYTQVRELGELETPIVLVNTLSVGRAVEALVDWTLRQPGCEEVCSVNAVVGETNDSPLNDIRERGIKAADVIEAIETASSGPVAMGAVGAGTGTIAFKLKAGIGSSSRVVSAGGSDYVVGALVQSNFDGVLSIDNVPIGKLQRKAIHASQVEPKGGSIVIVLATDAPLSDRNLHRLARRAIAGLAVAGASFENDSGDYAIAFSTHPECRRHMRVKSTQTVTDLPNHTISPLFRAAIESTEEAIYDSLLAAQSMTAFDVVRQRDISVDSIVDLADEYLKIDGD